MTFTETFGGFVCEGDAIHCEKDGYHVTARIFRDDCPDAPDKRQDGFWPSLYKDAPGFIGPGKNFRQRFDDAQARAEHIMGAWRKDDWFYCGVVLSVSFAEIKLLDCAASLWGVEANYPDTDNSYLTETANELLAEALDAARAEQARLCATLCNQDAASG
ncbi:MAG TPA: hypothetical protein DCR96_07040 [Hyphomonas sp.]|jgi:hypothetical protein|uniref:hypothetical protein n=1 Tax=Hyphomonas sp. UBA3195 TaxID=1946622 RepID=UPI000C481F90|nr:hypothetical protein [Hyphomonas sp. UBA3195]MAN89326.1 hypothetical protein [Hyphomonadaceae bacterium]HAQ76231.1 hypothetical protein [Hyphomonas sp.]|tara:strand:+ start:10064 stop:10543 length:480 start_codon:yes stop_codon:yes gene_type:complete